MPLGGAKGAAQLIAADELAQAAGVRQNGAEVAMAEVVIQCPQCAARYEIREADRDKPRHCDRCGNQFLPAATAEALVCDPAQAPAHEEPPTELAGPGTVTAPEPKPDPGVWQPGQVILDLYEVKQVHESGAMGLVYRVRHRGWDMDVAIKSPRPEAVRNESGKLQFEREAETWVRLGLHPHIVSCYYVRRINRIPHIFAEYVDGGTLADWIKDGKLYEGGPQPALERILDIAIQLAWGLHYAHEQGLVHQDVKPGNVLMTAQGLAKVTDFGLSRAQAAPAKKGARRSAGEESTVASGGGMTPAYCSPEQKARQPLSRKTDVWSWGVTVLEMFVGQLAWRDGTRANQLLDAYLTSGLPDKRPPPMPPRVAELLRQVFRDIPDERPPTMRALVDVLQDVYQQQTERLYPREAPEPAEVRADDLNNRAISLLDLGKREEAEKLWQKALDIEVQHPESAYNLALFRWRAQQLTEEQLVQQLREVCASHPGKWRPLYLLALVHLEREDVAAAQAALAQIRPADARRNDVEALRHRAGQRVSDARIPLLEYRSHQRHSSAVTSLAMSRDGRLALSGSHDWMAKLWEVETGDCLRTLEGHEGPVLAVALSRDGRLALTGSADKTVRVWDVGGGRCLRTLPGHGQQLAAVCLSPGQKYGLSASWDGSIKLWELATGKCVHTYLGHAGKVNALALDRAGKRFLSGGGSLRGEPNADHTIRLWDLTRGRSQRTLVGHTDRVAAVAFSPDGKHALSAGWDKTVRLWDLDTSECQRDFEGHTGRVSALCVNADGSVVFSAGEDQSVRMWEVRSGKCLRIYRGAAAASAFAAHEVTALAVSHDGRRALTGCVDSSMRLWRIDADRLSPGMVCRVLDSEKARTGSQMYRQALHQARAALAQEDAAAAARHIRVARAQPGYGRKSEALEEWTGLYTRLARRTLNAAWEGQTIEGHGAAVTALFLSPDGRLAGSASKDHTVKLWDTTAGSCVRTFRGHEATVCSVHLSADQQYLLSASKDRSLRLWDREDGTCAQHFTGHKAAVRAGALTADRRFALSGSSDKTLKLWDVETGRCLRTYAGRSDEVSALGLSADGRFAVAGGLDRHLWMWDLVDGRCSRARGKLPESITAICLSDVGWQALSANRGRKFHLWDLTSKACVRAFEGHTDQVSALAHSADGRYALSGSSDRTARLWVVGSGRCVRAFEGHAAKVTAVGLSADGRLAVTGCEDGSIKLWVLDWELDNNSPADWDDGALPYVENFLTLHTPYAAEPPKFWSARRKVSDALTRRGTPSWNREDFENLRHTLGCAGYGWLRPEGVQRHLRRLATSWLEPPPCPW